MSRKFNYLVFIGRFEPFHIGHQEVIRSALQMADHVIVLVGSSFQPRTEKNPWTFPEREDMIRGSFGSDNARISVMPLRDKKYNDQKWAAGVQAQVNEAIRRSIVNNDRSEPEKLTVGIIGHSKDESSYYLKMFPQWGQPVEHQMNERVSATDIRDLIFSGSSPKFLAGVLPDNVFSKVQWFMDTPEYTLLKAEYDMVRKYKESWKAAPYPPTFVTTDAIVIQSGHVLLIQRAAAPGYGLWALPGGFLNQNEYIIDGMLRELREETKLKVPAPVLKGSIKGEKVFDLPGRSSRGRTITHAFFIELPPGPLPVVKGSDDAMAAKWVPFSEVREDQMFEDHFHILDHFIDIDQ